MPKNLEHQTLWDRRKPFIYIDKNKFHFAKERRKSNARPSGVPRAKKRVLYVKVHIYALVDPHSHLVRYVGQTAELHIRFRVHCNGKDPCTGQWVSQLKEKPVLVILETIEQKMWEPIHPHGSTELKHAETKWIKRFRHTVMNKNTRNNNSSSWDWLTNPDERQG